MLMLLVPFAPSCIGPCLTQHLTLSVNCQFGIISPVWPGCRELNGGIHRPSITYLVAKLTEELMLALYGASSPFITSWLSNSCWVGPASLT